MPHRHEYREEEDIGAMHIIPGPLLVVMFMAKAIRHPRRAVRRVVQAIRNIGQAMELDPEEQA